MAYLLFLIMLVCGVIVIFKLQIPQALFVPDYHKNLQTLQEKANAVVATNIAELPLEERYVPEQWR